MWMPWAVLAGCAVDPPEAAERRHAGPPRDAVVDAVRISMALRGMRPSTEDLEAVEVDAAALDGLVDGWLVDDAFYRTVREQHAQWLSIGSDVPAVWPRTGPLAEQTQAAVHRSHAEAPLVRVSAIVEAGRPYSDVFVGDDPWVDAVTAASHGLAFDEDGPTWQPSRWVDGRPPDGILSETALWARHTTNLSGKHRGRAQLVASIFLCDDIGARVIEPFEPDRLVPDEEADAIAVDPACLACHAALEPLAASLWGWPFGVGAEDIEEATEDGCTGTSSRLCYPVRPYDPGQEDAFAAHGMPSPSFYGTPLTSPGDLGRAVADDPRMPACIARRAIAWVRGIGPGEVDAAEAEARAADFAGSGLDYRVLMRAIATDPTFLDGPPVAVGPEAMSGLVEDLTGLRWTADIDVGCATDACWGEPADLLRTDREGYRNLAGGADGNLLGVPDRSISPTRLLVLDALAMAAAERVVREDFALSRASERLLLTAVDADTIASDLVRSQLAALQWRVLGTRAHDAELDEWHLLFELGRRQEGEPAGGWRLVLRTLLADPAVVTR